jgi:2-oxoisovalerate dehydrogenase E1 component alpha subunit
LEEQVRAANAEAQGYGILSDGPHHQASTMFEDVFKDMPWHLREQQDELLRLTETGRGGA